MPAARHLCSTSAYIKYANIYDMPKYRYANILLTTYFDSANTLFPEFISTMELHGIVPFFVHVERMSGYG